LGSHVAMSEQKWFFHVWIALSVAFRRWSCGGTRWNATFVGALVVNNAQFRCVAVQLESALQFGPCVSKLAGLASLGRLGQAGVAVVIVEYHNIVKTARGLYWEFACLIRIGFS
jgi:hypothetical protein